MTCAICKKTIKSDEDYVTYQRKDYYVPEKGWLPRKKDKHVHLDCFCRISKDISELLKNT